MLIAITVVAVTASFFTYTYLAKKRVAALRVSNDDSDASNTEEPPEPFITDGHSSESAFKTTVNQDDDHTSFLPSPNATPKQMPQPDSALTPTLPVPNGTLKPSPAQQLPKPSSSTSTLMPPPPRPTPSSSRIRTFNTSLRPPPSAASSLRAQPLTTQRTSAFAPSTSTLPPPSRASKKVLLAPGHSPLDWAALTRAPPSPTFLRGQDVPVGRMVKVTPRMLREHSGRKLKEGKEGRAGVWGVFGGRVYNMSPYLDFHPGGVGEIMKAAGNTKGERLFMEVHPWVSWENMLGDCCVGILVGEGEGEGERASIEDMD